MTHTPYSETVVNTTTSGRQTVSATLALDDGGWVVVWNSVGQDGDGNGVYQQVYNADGSARGEETQVNTYTSGNQYFRSVTALADSGWLVTMESVGQDGDDRGIYQQRFDADGATVGEETLVNTTTTGKQSRAETTLLADGGWLVTWNSWNSSATTATSTSSATMPTAPRWAARRASTPLSRAGRLILWSRRSPMAAGSWFGYLMARTVAAPAFTSRSMTPTAIPWATKIWSTAIRQEIRAAIPPSPPLPTAAGS